MKLYQMGCNLVRRPFGGWRRGVVAVCLAAAFTTPALAQVRHAARARAAATADTLPGDTAVTIGTLPNGLRYYIRVNRTPAQRAELRLAVDAGSTFEDSTQRGLAHFVEHMAFNGTTHFGRLEIKRYLESMGMAFGADVNAETSHSATVYRFTIPTDRADALPTGVRILADWVHGVTFDSAAVEAERGIVMGEW
ncbi:MAG: insulinase family protein, partial [Gemmatimonadaceae bacterium]|nr:insulinase family protein [Gemmatimonadaceae bacterium]